MRQTTLPPLPRRHHAKASKLHVKYQETLQYLLQDYYPHTVQRLESEVNEMVDKLVKIVDYETQYVEESSVNSSQEQVRIHLHHLSHIL
jgi:hypothetical protein